MADFSDKDDDVPDDSEIKLASIGHSKTITLSISANYTAWQAREAFRELVQNWRDAIISSHNLREHQFTVIRESRVLSNSCVEIVYKVLDPSPTNTGEYLGYISFTDQNGSGVIEITNRRATLEPGHLDLGHTTKQDSDTQAGVHGEGLKIALLVLIRSPQNHAVRCCSGDFNWRFNFTNRGRLAAVLTRMSDRQIDKAQKDAEKRIAGGSAIPFAASSGKDVQFLIGEKRRTRNERGHFAKRCQVTRASFEAWIKSALFLCAVQDGGIISTTHGDLLTSPQSVGCLYLKGLLLSETTAEKSASITTLPLKFGYNFAQGQTNRERQSIAGPLAESRAILAIWKEVVAKQPDMVKQLSDMLNSDEPKYADVHRAEINLKNDWATAKLLRDYLLGGDLGSKWYYSIEQLRENARLEDTIRGFDCEGVQLTEMYWNILRGHSLLRTAAEEEEHRFRAAQATSVPATSFAEAVNRILNICLQRCQRATDISITFVQAGQLQLPLHYSADDGTLLIHERWLDVEMAAEWLGLPEELTEADKVYHTVEKLFTMSLEQLPDTEVVDQDQPKTAKWRMEREIRFMKQDLLNHFRTRIAVSDKVGTANTLGITWIDASHAKNISVLIQCHRMATCSGLRERLMRGDGLPEELRCGAEDQQDQQDQRCRLRQRTVKKEGFHEEEDLEAGEDYFFVFQKSDDSGAFPYVSGIKKADPSSSPASDSSNDSDTSSSDSGMSSNDRGTSSSDSDTSSGDSDNTVELSAFGGETHLPTGNGSPGAALPPTAASSQSRNVGPVGPSSQLGSHASEPDLFERGARLHALNVFDLERCYEAKGANGEQAVIVMIKKAGGLQGETRKRKRADEDE